MSDDRQPIGRFEWERLVRRISMPVGVKLLALVLASYADPDGSRVHPGRDRLAAVTGQSESTVKRSLRVLRDEFGLLEQMSPGGGRGRHGFAATYRLAVPTDLLERCDLLDADENRRVTQTARQSEVDTPDPRVTQMTHQSNGEPVDNSDRRVTHMTPQSDEAEAIDGSCVTPQSELTGHFRELTGHSCDPLPPTTPTTRETTHVGHPPAQPDDRARDRRQDHPHRGNNRPPNRTEPAMQPSPSRAAAMAHIRATLNRTEAS